METFLDLHDIKIASLTEVNSVQEALPDQTERPFNHPSACSCSTAASAREVSPTTFKGLRQ